MRLSKEMCQNCEEPLPCDSPYMDGECPKLHNTRPNKGIQLPTALKIELMNTLALGNPLSSEEV
jgi:hypothetical protein